MRIGKRLAGAVGGGLAAAVVAAVPALADGSNGEAGGQQPDVAQHEQMMGDNPGMERMHERMMGGNPGMERMHELMMSGDASPGQPDRDS